MAWHVTGKDEAGIPPRPLLNTGVVTSSAT